MKEKHRAMDVVADRIQVVTGDITVQHVDAIVNAANPSLLGGGGVDGAIHRAAGPELLAECQTIGGCPRGEARLTRGYRLPARYVIHTVGPVWHGGAQNEDATLASCYDQSLRLAEEHHVRTIAFPMISTGAYGFPRERAARIALGRARDWLVKHDLPEKIVFCCFGTADRDLYLALLEAAQDEARRGEGPKT